jgi:prolipoprotein diacylglyceryl transferase
LLLYLPSPGSNAIGPFRAYGLMIALGVIAGVELARHRWKRMGGIDEDIAAIAIWAVPAGLIGARLYHVITDWNRLYADDPTAAFEIWNGGLGIPGGILAGVVVGILVGRHRNINVPVGLDMAAPCLPLAQAIGRFGNWFNQELYGRPSELPWAVEIDAVHRQPGYEAYTTFQPTFLYEVLWNLALCGLLLWIDSKKVLRPGGLFALYVAGYGVGRLWIESLRIDTASLVLGLRINIWVSLLLIVVPLAYLAVGGIRRRPDDDFSAYVGGAPRGAGDADLPADVTDEDQTA